MQIKNQRLSPMNADTFDISRQMYKQLFIKEKCVTYYCNRNIQSVHLCQVYVIYKNSMLIYLESTFPL